MGVNISKALVTIMSTLILLPVSFTLFYGSIGGQSVTIIDEDITVGGFEDTAVYIPKFYTGGVSVINAIADDHPTIKFYITKTDNNNGDQVYNQVTQDEITALQAIGDNVLVGFYIYTDYAERPTATVQARIDKSAQYGVDFVFFDEMANDNNATHQTYYSSLTAYADASQIPYTIGNPGTSTLAGYVGTVDTMFIYENAGAPLLSPSTIETRTFNNAYDKSNFGAIPYEQTPLTWGDTYTDWIDATIDDLGMYYITTDGGSNPWDTLSIFTDELADYLDDVQTETTITETTTTVIPGFSSRVDSTTLIALQVLPILGAIVIGVHFLKQIRGKE